MIHLLRRTKLLVLVKIPMHTPTQFPSVSSLEQLSFLRTLVSAQDNIRKYSFSTSSLIGNYLESGIERLHSSERPELVLKFFKDNGFSESQIKDILSRWPLILMSDPEKTLKPKMDFLFSKGMSKSDFVAIVTEERMVLARSLTKYMIPLFDFLSDVVGEENAARAVRSYPYVFRCGVRMSLELNTKKLLNAGVPNHRVAKLIVHRLRGITPQPSRFEEALTQVKEMGFEPTEPPFCNAVVAVGCSSKLGWEVKMNLFRSYGLSDSEILAGFKRQSVIMMLKQKNMEDKMNFFIEGMHWSPHKIMMAPTILLLSLEKRIIPRLTVLYLLVKRGEVETGAISSVQNFLKMPEKKFFEKFVTAYEVRIPEVLGATQGRLMMEDLHTLNSYAAFNRNDYWSGT